MPKGAKALGFCLQNKRCSSQQITSLLDPGLLGHRSQILDCTFMILTRFSQSGSLTEDTRGLGLKCRCGGGGWWKGWARQVGGERMERLLARSQHFSPASLWASEGLCWGFSLYLTRSSTSNLQGLSLQCKAESTFLGLIPGLPAAPSLMAVILR